MNKKTSKQDHPLPGVQYLLIGGPGEKCISNGYSWKQSRITKKKRG